MFHIFTVHEKQTKVLNRAIIKLKTIHLSFTKYKKNKLQMLGEFENKSDDSADDFDNDFDDIESEFSNAHKGYSQREKVSLILSH